MEIYKKGISDKEMYRTFNCGVGFILSADPKKAGEIISRVKNFKADIIGKIVPGTGGVEIDSAFSNKVITF